MTSRDFVYWLQGFFEIGEPKELNEKQTQMIKNHLGLVFKHEIDPSYSDDPEIQSEMNNIHNGNFNYTSNNVNIESNPSTPGPGGRDENGELYRC